MSNEITIKLMCSIENICKILEDKGFKVVEKFLLDDTYFIPENLKIENMTPRKILESAVILRDITEYMPANRVIKFTFKKKQINEKGVILKQSKIDCEISNIDSGKRFIEAIGYKQIMNIKENDVVYEKDGFKIAIKDIVNGDKLIEVEENEKLDTIEKLKQKIEELQIPIDTNDYFVKKAEIELKKVL